VESPEGAAVGAGATVITVTQDGAVDINAGTKAVTISGNVAITGSLDVS